MLPFSVLVLLVLAAAEGARTSGAARIIGVGPNPNRFEEGS